LAKKYKAVGFKPELNNSNGINKNAIKHISYNFKKCENLDSANVFNSN
jgi:hypothetical protein